MKKNKLIAMKIKISKTKIKVSDILARISKPRQLKVGIKETEMGGVKRHQVKPLVFVIYIRVTVL